MIVVPTSVAVSIPMLGVQILALLADFVGWLAMVVGQNFRICSMDGRGNPQETLVTSNSENPRRTSAVGTWYHPVLRRKLWQRCWHCHHQVENKPRCQHVTHQTAALQAISFDAWGMLSLKTNLLRTMITLKVVRVRIRRIITMIYIDIS